MAITSPCSGFEQAVALLGVKGHILLNSMPSCPSLFSGASQKCASYLAHTWWDWTPYLVLPSPRDPAREASSGPPLVGLPYLQLYSPPRNSSASPPSPPFWCPHPTCCLYNLCQWLSLQMQHQCNNAGLFAYAIYSLGGTNVPYAMFATTYAGPKIGQC